jgi:hypothetical protein
MCQAFSGVITKSNKVYWKAGVDSHIEILKLFVEDDPELKDDKEPGKNTFAPFEITPHNGNYLQPKQKWDFKLDLSIRPDWFFPAHEQLCINELPKWKKQVYTFNLEEVKNPINPIKIKHSNKVSKKELEALKEWDSVWDSVWAPVRDSEWDSVWASVRDSAWASVGDSVWDSVRASVRASVWDSVRDSVRASVWDSVGASVWAYIGNLFPLKEWKYTEKIKVKGYPFQSAVYLWKRGLVPSYGGKVWRLHKMCDKAKVIWEGKIN